LLNSIVGGGRKLEARLCLGTQAPLNGLHLPKDHGCAVSRWRKRMPSIAVMRRCGGLEGVGRNACRSSGQDATDSFRQRKKRRLTLGAPQRGSAANESANLFVRIKAGHNPFYRGAASALVLA
jgi:hypothetical protein